MCCSCFSRVSFKRPITYLVTTLILATVGSVPVDASRVSAATNLQEPNHQDSNAEELDQEELPTLKVTVVDEKGNPIQGATVYSSSWTEDPKYRKKANVPKKTNDDGEVHVDIYPQLNILRIWASKDGYAGVFFNWEEGETDSIPAEFQVTLQQGTVLQGTVVDSYGNPVAGAKVDVSRASGGKKVDSKPRVKLGTWLANGEDRAVTDENGRWMINNVPAGEDLRFRFMIEHPDFIKDKTRKEMGQYKVTLQQLRDGTAQFQLIKGIAIRGSVTDGDGNPVTKGLVVWGDRPYWEQGSQEIAIGEDGKFEVPPRPPGEVRLTIMAPGWMPVDRIVDLSSEKSEPQDFRLKPGKKLQLQFVDTAGNPIPNVFIGITKWHEQEALYNHRHPNVKNSEIPRVSNDKGVYTWDWAPDDLLTLRCSIREWRYSKEIDVVATDQLQTITVKRPFTISGNVINKESGEPIDKFSIVPVTYNSDSANARGIAQRSWQKDFESANFKFDEAFQYDDGRLVAFRFQAVGYRDYDTERFKADTDPLETTINLVPTEIRSVQVRLPDGSVCKTGKVWVAKPDQGTMISGFEDYFSGMERGLDLDSDGTVQYGAPGTRHAIVVASRDGYAEKYLDIDEPAGSLILQPWAKLSGQLVQDGKPVAGASVSARPIRQLGGGNPHVQDIFLATTDADGKFSFDKLPPVPTVVQSSLSPWREYPITSSRRVPVELKPGVEQVVSLGGGGVRVVGKVNLIGDNADQIEFRYGLNNLLRIDSGIPTPDHSRSPRKFAAGEAKAWNERMYVGLKTNTTHETFFVKIREDGTFLISGVRSGRYRFLIRMYEPPTGCLVEPVGYGFVEFSTSDFRSENNKIDLGTIDVELKPVPKVGDALPDFRFQDLNGRPHQISEYRGQYVMIDFWASWCKPCVAAFPDLAKIHNSFTDRDDAQLLSISVDQELSAAKTVALQKQLAWAVGFAGPSAEKGSSADALGVSTLPTYLVLDPQGNILYRGFSHDEAAKCIPARED